MASESGDQNSAASGGPVTDATDLTSDVRAVADRTSSPMVLLDRSGVIRYANPAAAWLVGRSQSSLRGVPVLTLVHPSDSRRVSKDLDEVLAGKSRGVPVEYRIRAVDGAWKTISATASNLLDLPSARGILVSATDVTDQRAQEQTLRNLALRDPITGLANRLALRDRLDTDMSAPRPLSVVFFDLDHFKRINECLGHTVGDVVLQTAATRIATLVPAPSMVAHFGADTFAVVLVGVDGKRAARLAWEVLAGLASPLFVAGHELRLEASAGVAVRDVAATPESILRDADAALGRAKALRRGGVEVFTEEMRTEVVDRLAMETDLRHAVERNELRLHFQPIVRLVTGQSEGSEALVRWRREAGEEIGPGTFIPVAEEAGLIAGIGEWVLATSIAALRAGRTERVSVNLSPRQLLDPGLPARVERALRTQRLRPERLAFEVTEAVVVENFELVSESLNRLRHLGCPVGLDDFGTGYSSLSYLRRLPVDFLKLDRALVEDVDTNPQSASIANTIVSLASTLSLATIAEGVERQAQADTLNGMGCHYGQGWLFGHAVPL